MDKVKKFGGGVHISWVDTAKGIGVIMVIIGHLWYSSNIPIINTIIYSFHVPMFFILSGYVYKHNDNQTNIEFIKKKAIRLLFPSFLFILLVMPLHIFMSIKNNNFNLWYILSDMFFLRGKVISGLAYWFFIVTFEVMVVERLLSVAKKNIKAKFLIAFLSFFIEYVLYHFDISINLFGINKAIIAFGFFTLGNALYDVSVTKVFLYNKIGNYKNLFFLVCFVVWLTAGVLFNGKVSMYAMELNKYWLFIISAISGSLLFFKICTIIDKYISIFRIIAPNTVFIIGTHVVITSAFSEFMKALNLDYTYIYSLTAIIFAITLVYTYIPICKFVNNKLPILNGRVRN